MSKKTHNNDEPWSRKFGEDENFKNRQYSRSARNGKKQEVAPLYKVLLFLFLALLIIPFATIYWNEKTKGNPEPKTSEQVMANKQGTSSSSESEKAESEAVSVADAGSEESRRNEGSSAEASAVKEKEEEISSPPVEQEEEVPQEAPESVETPANPEPEESLETAPENAGEYANTYTVQAGDNLYRIALNHGMDLEELKTVNGLTSDVAEIGMVLKVR